MSDRLSEAIDEVLLDRLLRARGPVRIDALCDDLGWSPIDVQTGLEKLRLAGCVLEIAPMGTASLLTSHIDVWSRFIRWATDAHRLVHVLPRTSSTQGVARQLIEEHGSKADGAVAVADEQSAGRGRIGRTWKSPAGTGVLFSFARVTENSDPGPTADQLLFATSVAVAQGIDDSLEPSPLHVQIKWPNDLLVDGRKIGGILVETFNLPLSGRRAAVIGIGINVDLTAEQLTHMAPELTGPVTSVVMCGRRVDRLHLLTAVLRRVDAAFELGDPGSLLAEWRRRSVLLSRQVQLRHDGRELRGQVIDLDPGEGLIVQTDTGAVVHLPGATTTIQ